MDTKKFVRVAMLTGLACLLTFFPKIAIGEGYVHFGDCIIYITAIMLGPVSGAIVGAVGHSLADLLSGFAVFAVPTFIIKGIMGFVIGKIVFKNTNIKRFILAGVAALVIVTLGYFLAEMLLLGRAAALMSLVSSPIQWTMSMIASAAVVPVLIKNRKGLGF